MLLKDNPSLPFGKIVTFGACSGSYPRNSSFHILTIRSGVPFNPSRSGLSPMYDKIVLTAYSISFVSVDLVSI